MALAGAEWSISRYAVGWTGQPESNDKEDAALHSVKQCPKESGNVPQHLCVPVRQHGPDLLRGTVRKQAISNAQGSARTRSTSHVITWQLQNAELATLRSVVFASVSSFSCAR